MADNEVRKIQELTKLEEEEKEFFGFNISEYTTTQEIHNAENPWLSQKSLQIMIEQYLSNRLDQGTYIVGEGEVKQLRLSAAARHELREDFRKLPSGRNAVRQSWDVYLKGNAPLQIIICILQSNIRLFRCFIISCRLLSQRMHCCNKKGVSFLFGCIGIK